MKSAEDVAAAQLAASTTFIFPVLAVVGTSAMMVVLFTTEYVTAFTPLNLTPVAPVNPVPVIVTKVPGEPDVGHK